MDKNSLLSSAKDNFSDALNLAALVRYGLVAITMPELLESYYMLKVWAKKLEEKIACAQKDKDDRKKQEYVTEKDLCKGYIQSYEEDVFEDFEPYIAGYLKEKKAEGFRADELAAAKEFVAVAEHLNNLQRKDWRQFLPEE